MQMLMDCALCHEEEENALHCYHNRLWRPYLVFILQRWCEDSLTTNGPNDISIVIVFHITFYGNIYDLVIVVTPISEQILLEFSFVWAKYQEGVEMVLKNGKMDIFM